MPVREGNEELDGLRRELGRERRRAEAAEADARRLREALDAAPEGFALFDAGDRYVYWNPVYEKLYADAGDALKVGAGFDAVVRRLVEAGAYRLERDRQEDWLRERLRRHADRSDTASQAMADGRTIRVAERRTGDGGAIGVHVDVTELQRREDALSVFLENNPIPAYLAERETFKFLLVNQAAVDFYGYSRERLLAMTTLDIRPPEDRAALMESVATLDVTATNGGLFRHRKASGEIVEVAIYARLVKYDARDCLVVAVLDFSEKRAQEHQLAYLARHDSLTGLPNRLAFEERLARCIALAESTGRPFSALCVDLEGFKDINGHFGHYVGDLLLKQAAARFARAAAPAFVARVGSDEFAVLLEQDSGVAQCQAVAEALLREAGRDFDLGVTQTAPGASIGVSVFPDHGPAGELHTHVATALARAREAGRGQVCFYDDALGAAADERQRLILDLKRALALDEFEVWLQPQADVTGAVFGYEALLRWRHPQRGLISPAVFIPLAEDSGLIVEIDAWVLRACCREAAGWREDLRIAVNISACQFVRADFLTWVRDILRETGLPARRLELEVTENVLVGDIAIAAGVLRRLKTLGVSVSLDDFGSGYSSLSYLQGLPFDRLKIDRSFVAGLKRGGKAQAIARAIVELGRGLGLPVLAEGVETRSQLAILREMGCTQFQGFLIGRPQPIANWAVDTHAA